MFTDAFYQAAFDYGGLKTSFHTRHPSAGLLCLKQIRPIYRAFDTSNGGHTYLELQFNGFIQGARHMLLAGSNFHKVANFSDSVFNVKINWNYLVPHGQTPLPVIISILCYELDGTSEGKEFVLVSKSGHVYMVIGQIQKISTIKAAVDRVDLRGDTIQCRLIFFLDSIGGVVSMPSAVAGKVMIPSSDGRIYVLENLSSSAQNGFIQ